MGLKKMHLCRRLWIGPRLEKGLNGGRSHGNIPEALKAVIQRGVERQTVQNRPSVVDRSGAGAGAGRFSWKGGRLTWRFYVTRSYHNTTSRQEIIV